MKSSSKKSFSMLESVLSLILISIVSVFVFRYAYIFYENYSQINKNYNNNINLDRAIFLIHNRYQNRAIGSENIVRMQEGKYLEFSIKDVDLSRGVFFENENKWIGISGILDVNSTNSTIDSIKLLNSNLSYLDYINKTFAQNGAFISLYNFDEPMSSSSIGYSSSNKKDVFLLKCKDIYCRGNIIDIFDLRLFNKNNKVKKALDDRREKVFFNVLDSSVLFALKKNNLIMYSDYKPWKGETYRNGVKHIVSKGISLFEYKDYSDYILLKICSNFNTCRTIKLQ
jgi:hypothetical protein